MKFDTDQLARNLQQLCPEAEFAFLFGSSKDGQVHPGGDIDIALYVAGQYEFDLVVRATSAVEQFASGIRPDISIINDNSDVVFRFEVLQGRRLFIRDMNVYLEFFSRTGREYEDQIADYRRQRQYRMEFAKTSRFSLPDNGNDSL